MPAFYLAGFTCRDRDDDRLFALTDDARIILGTPRRLGFQRDLYRIDHPDADANAIEDAYAEVEDGAAPSLRRLVDDGETEIDEEIAIALNLLATLTTRVPAVRNIFASVVKALGGRLTDLLMEHPEQFHGYLAEREAAGEDISGHASLEQLKEAWKSGRIGVEADPSALTLLGFQVTPDLYDLLVRRDWSILTVEDQARTGPIVTSDRPVVILPTKSYSGPAWAGLGLGTPETEIIFPLDRRHALSGRWSSGQHGQRITASRETVAFINGAMCRYAHRHVYTVSPLFYALDVERTVVRGDSFLRSYHGSASRGMTEG